MLNVYSLSHFETSFNGAARYFAVFISNFSSRWITINNFPILWSIRYFHIINIVSVLKPLLDKGWKLVIVKNSDLFNDRLYLICVLFVCIYIYVFIILTDVEFNTFSSVSVKSSPSTHPKTCNISYFSSNSQKQAIIQYG